MGYFAKDDAEGLRVMVSSFTRTPITAALPKAKICGQYVNAALAKSEARRHGFDEAIQLTGEGRVCEGSIANLFMFRKDAFATPPLSDGILDGKYTIWGMVVSGMDNVDQIKKGDPARNGTVANPDKIIKMQVAADAEKKS